MQNLHEKIYQKQDLSQQETFEVFNQFVGGEQDPINIAAFLVGLKMKGEAPQEVAGAAQALRKNANFFDRPNYATADSCGTGGSGKHTLNISTLVSVIAATKGLKMVKHGNRSISSKCGSADVLEQLNVKIDMSPEVARKCLDEVGVTFLFAPLYHPGVKHVMPVRNALKTRTIFNLLGPLINPANPEYQLMGVYSPDHCFAAAESLRLSGCRSAMVVHSNGCDEITLSGNTHVAELRDGKITEYELTLSDFGLNEVPLSALFGGSPEENAQKFAEVLQGKSEQPIVDTVAANAGALFYVSGNSQSLKQGVAEAQDIIHSGQAFDKLLALAELSNSGA
ncbi:anthranilate phosphoribosyltransferase [Aliikangiella coralliicola]|uniref:Anthranilate phosphoribosyltransferase n=1 Tax=Aliikangiella coralliicola TaxID=2592383 RepID=A0A545TWG1_9GAMM|nr:anthranilate phosphoribosyltransferase [Aliikangiella coralliicola]TQV81544.1 anthranilate phosphoribosyltransferase [Aliikangiella coralliicola]